MKKLIFRLLRRQMVLTMHEAGFTWSKINTVLEAFGQKIITCYVISKEKKGIEIHFADPPKRKYAKPTGRTHK